MVSTGLHMTELATKWKELFSDVQISVFTAENSRLDKPQNKLSFEIYNGVSINRVKNVGKHHGNLFNRFLFSFAFIVKAFFFICKNRKSFDIVIITTNPPFLGILMLIINYIFKIPYVVIAYDIYPQILSSLSILQENSLVYKFWKWLNIKVYNLSLKIISIGNDMSEIIKKDMQVKEDKIELIHNWSDKNIVYPVLRECNNFLIKNNLIDKKILLYSGTLGTTHNIESILIAADDLKDYKEVIFLFIGSGAKERLVKDYISNSGNTNVILMPFQPLEILPETLSSASLSFVCLDDSFTGLSVPSKSYGILASKVPIVGLMSEEAEISQMIKKYDCGIVWSKSNNERLSKVILELLLDEVRIKKMADNAYNLFLRKFEIEISVRKYNTVLSNLVN